jgi:glutathione S-transferase
MRPCV